DTIGAAVAAYLDAGDFTPASRTTYRRVLEGMARQLGPGRPVAELDAGELAAWFGRTRAAMARPPGTATGSSSAPSSATCRRTAPRWSCPRSSTTASAPTPPGPR